MMVGVDGEGSVCGRIDGICMLRLVVVHGSLQRIITGCTER